MRGFGKVAKFQTSSFSLYQGWEGCKGCKISDFINLRIPELQRLQSLRLYHFEEIKVVRVSFYLIFFTHVILC